MLSKTTSISSPDHKRPLFVIFSISVLFIELKFYSIQVCHPLKIVNTLNENELFQIFLFLMNMRYLLIKFYILFVEGKDFKLYSLLILKLFLKDL